MQTQSRHTQPVGFVLMPGFALMSYASATEPLRAANLLAGTDLYEIVAFSLDGSAVASSSGALVPCRPLADYGGRLHTLFVCAGGNPGDWHSPELHALLRQLSRQGVRIGGISGGPYMLAAAGLLHERDFTIHWEHAPALKEAFPHLNPRQARFVIDGNRITCGGGVAPLDMMHALIAERMGSVFARRVSDWYLHTAVAEPAAPQRASAAERFGVFHPVLLNILEKMETTIEQPLSRGSMATFAGISQRHLDRLFTKHLKTGFLETYRQTRLRHAHRLLLQSPLSISEIAFATGFSSAAHFSRAYRALYGSTPGQSRR
ncbi:MAG: GlxA family transcriptional regulator [Shinella sp.]|jgi:AraC family transcriptional regulator, glycine betaine-responsive activator|nr:GlxA family transcriptional regulator [Shinella sp.]